MTTETFSFPHPVLGLSIGQSADIKGEINLKMTVERNKENRTIRFYISDLKIYNEYFNNLIGSGKAGFLIKVYCSSTFKTWTFINTIDFFEIPEEELCNKIEIDPKIIALEEIPNYSDSSFDPEFDKLSFTINKYDIIGILEKTTIPIDKEYEMLGLGNIFEFQPESDYTIPCSYDFNRDKILIKYPPTINGDHPPNALFNKAPFTAYNIFIVPAISEAFRIMADKDKKTAVEGNEWYYVLNSLLPIDERDDDPFINAQLILNREIPVLKSFNELCS